MGIPSPDPLHDADATLQVWRQGDVTLDAGLTFVHFADLSRPISPAARRAAEAMLYEGEALPEGPVPLMDDVPGFVMLTQTCDIVRPSAERPYVEVAPLIMVSLEWLEDIRMLRRPAFAYVPALAEERLVADLDRIMTVEKAVVAPWRRIPGWSTDNEIRAFAKALARKRARFAFPDDFNEAATKLQERFKKRHNRQHAEGAHLKALSEIRIRAAPSWDTDQVTISLWFIKSGDPEGIPAAWSDWMDAWTALFDESGRFQIETAVACLLEDMTARDYVDSDRLDLDQLSVSPKGKQG
jgi:hypothetical protein